jgi:RNA polymerase sigma-70 factor (ECF subfamily)
VSVFTWISGDFRRPGERLQPVAAERTIAGMSETRRSRLRRVRNRADQASWQEFVALYTPLLERYVRLGGLSGADVDDAVQQVFVRLLDQLPGFELDPGRGRFRD